jgi:serine/threonine protein kinase
MNDDARIAGTIGRYEILRELGRGAMGIVYEGHDPVIGRRVALKTIAFAADDRDSRELRKRLFREAAAAGTLAHPNIVTIYDIVDDGAVTAVAMELVEGQPLSAYVGDGRTLPFEQALQIFEQISAALDYAGARGIVHRDIKPANILLTSDGRVKILDFGIARFALGDQTQTSTIMGSPSYMSPEQVRGLPLDARSDLFSAAVVLFEMLTGLRPFGGDDVATTMYRIVHEQPRVVREINPAVTPAVAAVLEWALAKNPAERAQSGAEFVAELHRAAGAGSEAPPPTTATVIRPVPTYAPPVSATHREPAPAGAVAGEAVTDTELPRKSPFLIAGLVGSGIMLAVVVLVVVYLANRTTSTGPAGGGGGAPIVQPAPPPSTATVAPRSDASELVRNETPPQTQSPVGAEVAGQPARPSAERGGSEAAGPASVQNQPAAQSGTAAPAGQKRTGAAAVPQPTSTATQPPGASEPRAAAARQPPATIASLPPPPPMPTRTATEDTPPSVPPPTPPAKPAARPAAEAAAPAVSPAAEPVAVPGGAVLRIGFDAQPYPVTLFAGDARLGRVDTADASLGVEAGSVRLRAVNETLFLDIDLGTLTLRPGERRTVALPGLASAAFAVRGDDYTGVRILVDGRQIPGPYPAQVGRIAPGAHRVVYRWISGPAAGREVTDGIVLSAGGHFIIRAGLDNDKVAVQQLR